MSDFNATPFNTQRSAATSQYGASGARRLYSQFLAQQRGTRKIADTTRTWQDKFPSFASGFSKRGLSGPGVQSGVYNKAMQTFAADQTRAIQYATDEKDADYNTGLLDNDFADADYQTTMSNIAAQQAMAQSQAAATLTSFKPFLGA